MLRCLNNLANSVYYRNIYVNFSKVAQSILLKYSGGWGVTSGRWRARRPQDLSPTWEKEKNNKQTTTNWRNQLKESSGWQRNSQNPAEFKNRRWPHKKVQEAHYLRHPIPQSRADWHQERSAQKKLTTGGRGEPQQASFCYRDSGLFYRCLLQSSTALIPANGAAQSTPLPPPNPHPLPEAGAVIAVTPALRGPSHNVPWSQGWGTTAHHTWEGAATALAPHLAPDPDFVPSLPGQCLLPRALWRVLYCSSKPSLLGWAATALTLDPDTWLLTDYKWGHAAADLWLPHWDQRGDSDHHTQAVLLCILLPDPDLPLYLIISRPMPLLHPYMLARVTTVRSWDPSPSSMGDLPKLAPPKTSTKPQQVHLGPRTWAV